MGRRHARRRPGRSRPALRRHHRRPLLTSLVVVDVATLWTELQALWGLHYHHVCDGVRYVNARFPFPLREWHSDNGSEFLNARLLAWCRTHHIRFTRGRPYRKNDQAWVEQRNGLVVRRLVGYDRFASRPALAALQQLYRLLRLQLNFFRPVRKLASKQRHGGRVRKRYDAAQTPFQRVLAADVLTTPRRRALEAQFAALDPIALARDIQRTLATLWRLAERTLRSRSSPVGNRILRHRLRRSVTPPSEASRRRREAPVHPLRRAPGGD